MAPALAPAGGGAVFTREGIGADCSAVWQRAAEPPPG